MLQVKHVTKSYTTGDFKQIALDDVSLDFRPHEFVAILGASGSGKTTFLNMVGGLDRYDHGDLVINGKSTKHFKDRDWDAYRNHSIGFIFQSYNLITHLSILDNVEMGMTLSGVSSAEKREKAIDALTRVGLKEHLHKHPNQLSGGQMQRVAIARALANDPSIILADEPTGALDTQTSIQIMELIKEIAADKLVIMVTHNPELADTYADRIVQFQDGKVVSDSNPTEGEDLSSEYQLKKTSMGFLTALKLSGKNICTKLGRTGLTAFASSIGIIGIALVLSLSNGFDKQIGQFESNTLSGFPIMITQSTEEFDAEQMQQQHSEMMGISTDTDGQYPEEKVIYPYDASQYQVTHENLFSDEYINYIEQMDSSLLSGISYTRLVNMNLLHQSGDEVSLANTSTLNFSAYPTNLDENNKSYLEQNYDLLAGEYPTKETDLILITDTYNRLDQSILKELGLDVDADSISLDDLVGQEFKIVHNNDFYTQTGDYFIANARSEQLISLYDNENNQTVRICGVLRANKDISMEVLSSGIAYSDQLSQSFIEDAQSSSVVLAQKDADFNVLTGEAFAEETQQKSSGGMMGGGSSSAQTATKDDILASLGADSTPYMINLYPTDFTTKEQVLDYLNAWNDKHDAQEQVLYTDLAQTFTDLSGSIMDAITLVLVAFAAVSLVVSLIMIGIITYISVLERTKEIGVLRALGARKKDISRVFNAETFIVGTCSGLLGIGIAFALTFPVNSILEKMTDLPNVAQLNPLHALLLVAVSVLLTMLGGVIPARMAAKKDPVEALRSE